ncbi:alpha/beta hydrolase [Romboutsia maritimum]|uniref:Alpha/beta hydrolase n=1 Tax=Romboutsia maritimum TaxID=2020948 RepID=A0A371IT81_9FIRM|nr:alpha/beta hydrolase [Romboutsia maritimum]RDY23681.1 alpha/beta hydrolase [Romboutsia maritimum]
MVINIVVILWLVMSYIIGKLVYDGSVGSSQKIKNEDVVEVFSKREDKPFEKLSNYKTEEILIDTLNNYKIESMFINSNKQTNNTMVLVHGIESYYFEMLKTAFNYLENGYNVLIYNQRHTGNSGGNDYTFGFYERFDLDGVIKYVKEKIPDGKIGVHGYSMGAATSAMHTELNEKYKNVDFYILDSPFSNMKEAIRLGIIEKKIPIIPTSYIELCGNIYTKFKSGFWYKDVEPFEAVSKTSVPIMFIHGTSDTTCNPENSKQMYDLINHDKKELWHIEGTKHVNGYNDKGQEYFNRIFNFIKNNVN